MKLSRNCGNSSQNAVRHPLSAYAKSKWLLQHTSRGHRCNSCFCTPLSWCSSLWPHCLYVRTIQPSGCNFPLRKYKEAMAELGLDCPEEYIFEGNFWKDCALDASKHFMSLKNVLKQLSAPTTTWHSLFAKNLHYRVIQCHRISPFPVLMMCGMRVQMYHR